MADHRSDADKAAGLIPVVWAGKIVRVPTLKRRAAAEWRADVGVRLRGMIKGDFTNVDHVMGSLQGVPELVLDALMAYDVHGVLGDRAKIDEEVDDALIYAALVEVLKVVFPFVSDLRGVISEIGTLLALQGTAPGADPSAKPSSTNGSSPIGDSTLTG